MDATCPHVNEIVDLIYGRNQPKHQEWMEHLAACAVCYRRYEQLKKGRVSILYDVLEWMGFDPKPKIRH